MTGGPGDVAGRMDQDPADVVGQLRDLRRSTAMPGSEPLLQPAHELTRPFLRR